MNKNEVFEKVKAVILNELDVKAEKVTLQAKLKEDLGADSIDAVQIIMALEDEFEIKLEDDNLEKISTVEDTLKRYEAYGWHVQSIDGHSENEIKEAFEKAKEKE